MTLWILWSMVVSAMVAGATSAMERIAGHIGAPRRFLWIGATLISVTASLAIALRPAPGVHSAPSTDTPVVATMTFPTLATTAIRPAIVAARSHPVDQAWTRTRRVVAWIDGWITPVWLLTSFVWFVALVQSVVRQRRRRAGWRELDVDTCRVLVARDDGPAVVGVLRPRIVVPQWAVDADRSTRDLLLRHELEHIRGGDTRILFAAVLLQMVFPWNGALSWMVRRLRLAIEIDCDARVIRAVRNARAYGLMLLAAGERHAAGLPMSAFLSERQTSLEARINAMTTPRHRRPIAASLPFAGIALVVLATAAWTPRPAPVARPQRAMPPLQIVPRVSAANTVAGKTPRVTPITVSRAINRRPTYAVPPAPALTAPTSADPKPLRGNRAPAYPDSLRTAGVEGSVTLRFSTDARGVPDTSSIQVVASAHALFESAVRQVLPSWRFDSPGLVRMAFRFMTVDTEQREAANQNALLYVVDGVAVAPVVIVSAIFPSRPVVRPPTESAAGSTPAKRAFDAYMEAFNSADPAQFIRYQEQHMPPQAKDGMIKLQRETGGFELISIGRVDSLSLDFAARERRTGSLLGGYFALREKDTTQIGAFRVFYAREGRSLDDAALLARLYRRR